MEFLGFLLAFVGFFGFIIFLIIFIIMAILKKQKAPFGITMCCCFVSLILGAFILGRIDSNAQVLENKIDQSQSNSNSLGNNLYDHKNGSITGTPITNDNKETIDDESEWSKSFTPINDFRYSLDKENHTITLKRYSGEDTKIMLSPSYIIDGIEYDLVSMGDNACFLCETKITSVYIPEGVTYIGNSCFNSCSSLQYLYIPSTVKSLDNTFFDYIHEYNAYCDSKPNFSITKDLNDYTEILDDKSVSEELGENLGRAVNGMVAGLANDSSNSVVTEIYYGGSEEQWINLTK